jgi:hypothetical protein
VNTATGPGWRRPTVDFQELVAERGASVNSPAAKIAITFRRCSKLYVRGKTASGLPPKRVLVKTSKRQSSQRLMASNEARLRCAAPTPSAAERSHGIAAWPRSAEHRPRARDGRARSRPRGAPRRRSGARRRPRRRRGTASLPEVSGSRRPLAFEASECVAHLRPAALDPRRIARRLRTQDPFVQQADGLVGASGWCRATGGSPLAG